jgi:hypothetical protein
VEVIGYVALAIGVLGYLWSDPRDVLKFSIPSAVLWVAYFSTLGVWTALATSVLALVRLACGAFLGDALMRVLSLAILAVLTMVFVALHPGWIAMLPIMAAVWKTTSLWLRDHPLMFRGSLVGAEAALLLFALQASAQALMVSSALVIGVNIWKAAEIALQRRQSAT